MRFFKYRIQSDMAKDMAKLIPLTARNDRAKSEISALRTKWRSAVPTIPVDESRWRLWRL